MPRQQPSLARVLDLLADSIMSLYQVLIYGSCSRLRCVSPWSPRYVGPMPQLHRFQETLCGGLAYRNPYLHCQHRGYEIGHWRHYSELLSARSYPQCHQVSVVSFASFVYKYRSFISAYLGCLAYLQISHLSWRPSLSIPTFNPGVIASPLTARLKIAENPESSIEKYGPR